MPIKDQLEQAVKVMGLVAELTKMVAIAVLTLVVVSAFAAPEWIGGRLDKLNMQIDSVNAGIVKIVAKESKKTNAHAIQVAEALTKAEVQISEQPQSPDNAKALQVIREAKAALDEQGVSIQSIASKVGLEQSLPATAWLYIGYFSEAKELRRLADRIQPNSIAYANGKLSQVSLQFDAPVVSDGNNCSRPDVKDFAPPDPKAPERKYIILKAPGAPLNIVSTVECDSAGKGKQIYAEIQIPSSRVRFAELSTLQR